MTTSKDRPHIPRVRRHRLRTLTATTAALAAVFLTGSPAQARIFETTAPYQPQVSCDPVAKPGVLAFRALVLRKFGGGDLGIARACHIGGDSEHKEGRAWDYGLNWYDKTDRARARRTLAWLTETVRDDPARRAKRLGVMYMIWNQRIWSASRATDGWRPYDGASPHRDHIHFSFTWNGATKRTSWWTGEVEPFDYGPCTRWVGELAPRWRAPRLTPCPTPIHRPTINPDGTYTAQPGETVARVARFFDRTRTQVRRWNGLPRTGPVEVPVGSRLRVVPPADATGRYRVRAGDTVPRVAGYFAVRGGQVRRWNGLPRTGPVTLTPGRWLIVVRPDPEPDPAPEPDAEPDAPAQP